MINKKKIYTQGINTKAFCQFYFLSNTNLLICENPFLFIISFQRYTVHNLHKHDRKVLLINHWVYIVYHCVYVDKHKNALNNQQM